MAFRPRLIPAVIIAASALLGLKAADFVLDGGTNSIAAAWGQTAVPTASAPPVALTPTPAPAPASAPASAPATPPAATSAPPSEVAANPAPPAAPKASVAQAKEGQDPLLMSPAEVEVLQNLSNRRTELDKQAAELRQREVVMQAAEKRIDEKIAKLQALQKSIDTTAQKQSEEDDARIKSLVGIYERMKPRDAARIFEQLDMPVLISVLEHMREMKAAPILASMDPAKAKAVTLALAERHDGQATTQPVDKSVAQAQSAAR
jgi:flagellar motility protein MotE (MotC chaperone)